MSRAARVGAFYFLYFGAVGITLPFLPAYFKSLALSGTQIGALMALMSLVAMFVPAAWGSLGDRTHRPDRVLAWIAAGMVLTFTLLWWARRFVALLFVMGAYSSFSCGVTPLVDALALEIARERSMDFSRLRVYGSIGFVVVTLLFGWLTVKVDRSAVAAPLAVLVVMLGWSLTLPRVAASTEPRAPALNLLLEGRFAIVLAATTLHWIALAPFQAMFAIHVESLGLAPRVTSSAWAVGVATEVVVLFASPALLRRMSASALLAVSCFSGFVRWSGMAVATTAPAIVALSALHGVTFGAFYVAAVRLVADRAPERLRASAQSLFAAATFGLGGLLGYYGSGVGLDVFGSRKLYVVAALVDGVALAIAWAIQRADRAQMRTPRPA